MGERGRKRVSLLPKDLFQTLGRSSPATRKTSNNYGGDLPLPPRVRRSAVVPPTKRITKLRPTQQQQRSSQQEISEDQSRRQQRRGARAVGKHSVLGSGSGGGINDKRVTLQNYLNILNLMDNLKYQLPSVGCELHCSMLQQLLCKNRDIPLQRRNQESGSVTSNLFVTGLLGEPKSVCHDLYTFASWIDVENYVFQLLISLRSDCDSLSFSSISSSVSTIVTNTTNSIINVNTTTTTTATNAAAATTKISSFEYVSLLTERQKSLLFSRLRASLRINRVLRKFDQLSSIDTGKRSYRSAFRSRETTSTTSMTTTTNDINDFNYNFLGDGDLDDNDDNDSPIDFDVTMANNNGGRNIQINGIDGGTMERRVQSRIASNSRRVLSKFLVDLRNSYTRELQFNFDNHPQKSLISSCSLLSSSSCDCCFYSPRLFVYCSNSIVAAANVSSTVSAKTLGTAASNVVDGDCNGSFSKDSSNIDTVTIDTIRALFQASVLPSVMFDAALVLCDRLSDRQFLHDFHLTHLVANRETHGDTFAHLAKSRQIVEMGFYKRLYVLHMCVNILVNWLWTKQRLQHASLCGDGAILDVPPVNLMIARNMIDLFRSVDTLPFSLLQKMRKIVLHVV